MKTFALLAGLFFAVGAFAGPAAADSWREGGYGHWGGWYDDADDWRPRAYYRERRSYKEKYRVGGCKIERKWKDGGYKEKVKCKGGPAYGYRY